MLTGYACLSSETRATLREIARLAYGTGWHQGRVGGAGRMGLLGDGSNLRVIKFNTHWTDRAWLFGAAKNDQMVAASRRLRELLWSIAKSANLPPDVLGEIRGKLEVERATPSENLLSRKIVAFVVQCIGGNQVWEEVERQTAGGLSTENVPTAFEALENAPVANPSIRSVNELKPFNAFANDPQVFGGLIELEMHRLDLFGAKRKWNKEELSELKETLRSVLDPARLCPGGETDGFKIVSERDIRKAIRWTAVRLIAIQAGEKAAQLSAYLYGEKPGRRPAVNVGFYAAVRRLRDDMEGTFGDGKAFVSDLLVGMLRNDMRVPSPASRADRPWTAWGLTPIDRSLGSQVERDVLEDVLATRCEEHSRALLGEKFRTEDLKKIGLPLDAVKTAVAEFGKSFHLSDRQVAAYGHMVGEWLQAKLARNGGSPLSAYGVKIRILEGAPLCDVGDPGEERDDLNVYDTKRKTSWPGLIGKELFRPVSGVGSLCGSVRVEGAFVPLWRPIKKPGRNHTGEKVTQANQQDDREQKSVTRGLVSAIRKLADGDKDKAETLKGCCAAAGRDFLRLFVRDGDERNVTCHREFWKDKASGRLTYRISAVVGGQTFAATFQIEDDGRLTCKRLFQGDAIQQCTREEREEFEAIKDRQDAFRTETEGIDGDFPLSESDKELYGNPEIGSSLTRSPKETAAMDLINADNTQVANVKHYYNELRKNPSNPGGEGENREYDDWLEEQKRKGAASERHGWYYFDFEKERPPQQDGNRKSDSPTKDYKLYLTVPGDKVKDLTKDYLKRILSVFADLKKKSTGDFSVKFCKGSGYLSRMTDHVCGYFETQDDLNAAVEALKSAAKDEDVRYWVETGLDANLKVDLPVHGRNLKGKLEEQATISFTGVLALRIWVARCIRKGIPRGLRTEFNAAIRFLKKIDKDGLKGEDRMLVAYLHRFLYVRGGIPEELQEPVAAPVLRA